MTRCRLTDTPFGFLNVGAWFVLTNANLFPTEAARGSARIVLVRGQVLHV